LHDTTCWQTVIEHWFGQHVSHFDRQERGVALLSCLLSARRYDRVYGLGEKQIVVIVVKAWGIGANQQQELPSYKRKGT